MDIKQNYREESNLDVYAEHSLNYANYTNEYVKWLEAKLTLTDVSQQRELLIAFDTMRQFDIKHDDIEESIDYFLKHKERLTVASYKVWLASLLK